MQRSSKDGRKAKPIYRNILSSIQLCSFLLQIQEISSYIRPALRLSRVERLNMPERQNRLLLNTACGSYNPAVGFALHTYGTIVRIQVWSESALRMPKLNNDTCKQSNVGSAEHLELLLWRPRFLGTVTYFFYWTCFKLECPSCPIGPCTCTIIATRVSDQMTVNIGPKKFVLQFAHSPATRESVIGAILFLLLHSIWSNTQANIKEAPFIWFRFWGPNPSRYQNHSRKFRLR